MHSGSSYGGVGAGEAGWAGLPTSPQKERENRGSSYTSLVADKYGQSMFAVLRFIFIWALENVAKRMFFNSSWR